MQGASAHTDPGIRYNSLNQDAFLISSISCSPEETCFIFGVFDGHGKGTSFKFQNSVIYKTGGELAAETSKTTIDKYLKSELPKLNKQQKDTWGPLAQQLLQESFNQAHKDIIDLYPTLKSYVDYSGSRWNLQDDGTKEKQQVYKLASRTGYYELQVSNKREPSSFSSFSLFLAFPLSSLISSFTFCRILVQLL